MDKHKGNLIYMSIGSAVSVAVAILISRLMDQPVIGWAIGTAMMSVSAGLFMMPHRKQWAVKTAVWAVVSAAIMGLLVHYTGFSGS